MEIRVDSDGVFADWEGYVISNHFPHLKSAKELNKIERVERQKQMREMYERDPDLFANLPMLPNAAELARLLTKFYGPAWKVLTADGGDHPSHEKVKSDKINWYERNMGINASRVDVVLYSKDKCLHSGVGYVLIDDYDVNCQQWAEHGGTAILYKDGCSIGNVLSLLQSIRRNPLLYSGRVLTAFDAI